MKPNTIKDITDFIFLGKDFEELSHYDLLIINADWVEEQLAKDMKLMLDKNIIDNNTTFIICEGHGNTEKRSASILIDYLKKEGLTNKIIISDKYNRILRIAKDFVARRWYMNAKKYNFPIEKCDFYGVVDNRNISKKDWYKSEIGINQVMKEFINIGQLTIDKELDIN